MIGRRDEQGVAMKRKTGTERDGGPGGVFGGCGEPVFQVAEAQHGLRDGGEESVAVINEADAVARAGVVPDAPGAGGMQFDEKAGGHQASVSLAAKSGPEASAWSAARSPEASRSRSAAPDE